MGLIPGRGKIFSLLLKFQTGSGATQSPIEWVPGSFPPGLKGPCLKLIPHLYLILKLRMSGAITPPPHYAFKAQTGAIFYLCISSCVGHRQAFQIPTAIVYRYRSCVVSHRHFKQITGLYRSSMRSRLCLSHRIHQICY